MQPLITTFRNIFTDNETLSQVFIKEKMECFGLEDEIRTVKVAGETAIPYGTYPLGFHESPKFSDLFYFSEKQNKLIRAETFKKLATKLRQDFVHHKVIHIQNVPNFQFILIHPLNTEDETEGCLGLGKKIGKLNGKPAILESVAAYLDFYPKVYQEIKKGLELKNQKTILFKN